jgi:hypothetical protein
MLLKKFEIQIQPTCQPEAIPERTGRLLFVMNSFESLLSSLCER